MADSKIVVTDNLVNLVSGLGTGRAKSANSTFVDNQYSDQELLTTYRQNWLAAKIVDIPAQDATREWRSWQADKGEIEKIERLERNLGVQHKVLDALTLARLYGGAAIYIGTNASPSKPLDIERERLEYLAVISRRELSANEVEDDIRSPYFGQPKSYDLITRGSMVNIHPSRLVKFVGKSIPESFGSGYSYQQGWGDPVLVACMAPLLRTESTMANAGELMFESQVSVMKVPDLLSQLNDPDYRQSVLEMVALQAAGKGITKMMMIDAAQDYQNHNATFAGVPELINAFHQEDAGASGIPVTRLLGQSPGGLNSTGESDLRTHYDNIASMQKLTIGPAMSSLDEMLIRAALGSRPEEVHYNWNNLWYPSAKEQAEIGKTTADTIKTLGETGLFNSDALSAASVNLLTERGVVPGLEGAMDQFGEETEEESNPQEENDPTSNSANNA